MSIPICSGGDVPANVSSISFTNGGTTTYTINCTDPSGNTMPGWLATDPQIPPAVPLSNSLPLSLRTRLTPIQPVPLAPGVSETIHDPRSVGPNKGEQLPRLLGPNPAKH
jgi:hypothetical protein